MARYTGPKEKLERRIGEKLFLKGERSVSPKAAIVKRSYPPGMHGRKRKRALSEFGSQLVSKQKVRYIYRLMERQFKSYVDNATKAKENSIQHLIQTLEGRLDNIVYRIGFAQSRDQARQLVSHGHIVVNGRRVKIPSFSVKQGDSIELRKESQNNNYFKNLMPQWFQKHAVPGWINVDKIKIVGKIIGIPNLADSGLETRDLQAIIEFYSK